MNLEIKHILPYVQYGLMTDKGGVRGVELIRGEWCVKTDYNTIWHKLSHIKLLLKPLSGLDDDEELRDVLFDNLMPEEIEVFFNSPNIDLGNAMSYNSFQVLIQHKYDVFGLIDNGLAEVKG